MLSSDCPRALAVDDIADAAGMLSLLLRMWGYYAKANNGGAAVRSPRVPETRDGRYSCYESGAVENSAIMRRRRDVSSQSQSA